MVRLRGPWGGWDMPSDWPEVQLGDLVQIRHGWPFKSEYFSEVLTGRPIVVAIGNFQYTGGFRFDSTKTKEYIDEYPAGYELEPGELLLAMTCQTPGGEILGLPARVPADGRTYLHNQRLGRIHLRSPDHLDLSFFYWCCLSRPFKHHLVSTASGTKILHTSPGRIEAYQLPLPPLPEQRRIAAILGALDDKIELNRKMNRTLEEMAQALFKSWFIDFDGHDDLVDSEIGPVPRGWSCRTVEEMAEELETGNRPSGGVGEITEGVPSIGAESIDGVGRFDYSKTKYVPTEYFKRLRQGVIKSRDVLLYKDGGKPGDFRPHVGMYGDGFPFEQCALNSHVYRLRLKAPLTQEYGYFWFSSGSVMDEMRRLGTGVAIPSLPRRNLLAMKLLVPPGDVIRRFDEFAKPAVGRILANAKESQTLATLRDTLLPKLISGELRVPEAEDLVETEPGPASQYPAGEAVIR
jgi:type I restriction enzyme S subunit